MTSNYVVYVGSGEEYFAEDYEQVHCKHGTYIGYPGGPDYLCFECEMGYDHIYKREVFVLTYLGKPFQRFSFPGDALRVFGDFVELVEAHPGMLNDGFLDDWDFLTLVESYWGPAPEEEQRE